MQIIERFFIEKARTGIINYKTGASCSKKQVYARFIIPSNMMKLLVQNNIDDGHNVGDIDCRVIVHIGFLFVEYGRF